MLDKIQKIIENNGKNDNDLYYKKWDTEFRDELFKEVYWSYFPITQKYYFEANPAFISEFRNLFDLGRFPLVMLRDGYVGLLDFFFQQAKPTLDLPSEILIHKKFEKLVPKGWEDRIHLYSFMNKGEEKPCMENLVLHGIGTEELFWHSNLEQRLQALKDKCQGANIFLFLPQRNSPLSRKEHQDMKFNLKTMQIIFKVFGDEVTVETDSERFFKKFNFERFSFYNLDQSHVFVADNFLDHYLYSMGGSNFANEGEEPIGDHLSYDLSLKHKIIIEPVNIAKSHFPEFYLPHKLSGKKDISLYHIFRSDVFKKLFIKHF
ncbi:MAG: hypothetical protein QF441_13990 [Bacteriovoracaceae bacterium]|jgi:hypothetical protein|nr:hypothetical protein [Bacteriovoracaceae bacterium]